MEDANLDDSHGCTVGDTSPEPADGQIGIGRGLALSLKLGKYRQPRQIIGHNHHGPHPTFLGNQALAARAGARGGTNPENRQLLRSKDPVLGNQGPPGRGRAARAMTFSGLRDPPSSNTNTSASPPRRDTTTTSNATDHTHHHSNQHSRAPKAPGARITAAPGSPPRHANHDNHDHNDDHRDDQHYLYTDGAPCSPHYGGIGHNQVQQRTATTQPAEPSSLDATAEPTTCRPWDSTHVEPTTGEACSGTPSTVPPVWDSTQWQSVAGEEGGATTTGASPVVSTRRPASPASAAEEATPRSNLDALCHPNVLRTSLTQPVTHHPSTHAIGCNTAEFNSACHTGYASVPLQWWRGEGMDAQHIGPLDYG